MKDEKSKKQTKSICLFLIIFIVLITAFFSPNLNKASPITKFISLIFSPKIKVVNSMNYTTNSTEPLFNFSIENQNLIIILLESLSYDHISYNGYERNITPNIDWFFERGIVFNKTYSLASHSDLSQTSFLASLYPLKYKYRDFFTKPYPRFFAWDLLKEKNYSTAYFSSQNDLWANMINFYNKTNLDVYSHSLNDNEYDYGSGLMTQDFDEKTIAKAIDWINSTKQPFFLYLNFQATHEPYNYPENNSVFNPDVPSILSIFVLIPKEDLIAEKNRYDNSVLYVDKQIGALKEYLEKNNLLNNTIIVITSDHGETLENTHGNLRHGYGVYEGEIRVPLVISIPNQEHQIIDKRISHLDVIPTILGIMNFSEKDLDKFQGKPLTTKNKTIFSMVQSQNFKIGLIKNNIKLMYNFHKNNLEAYNLSIDEKENNNLINSTNLIEFEEYSQELFSWYYCQLDYYKNKKYETGEKINC